MKISFLITSTGWGGLEMNVIKLAKQLSSRQFSISLITREQSTIYTHGKEYFTSCLLLSKTLKYFDFGSAKKISNFLKSSDVTTILVFDNKDLDLTAWTKKLFYKKLKIIYQQHMQIGIDKKDFLHTFRFSCIDYWISPLNYLKNEVVKRTKFPEERIKVIPICLETATFTNRKYSKEETFQLLHISPKATLMGIIGRISKKKGQLFLIDSVIRLKEMGVSVELLIFGSATVNDTECQQYYSQLIEKVKDNNLEEVVHFVEFKEDVSQFYNAIDIFALASEGETYGMVTIEAMLSKLPIIATNTGGTSEILEDGNLGLLFEPGDKEDFCKKFLWILNNKKSAEDMAENAGKKAAQLYDKEIEVTAIEKLIKQLG